MKTNKLEILIAFLVMTMTSSMMVSLLRTSQQIDLIIFGIITLLSGGLTWLVVHKFIEAKQQINDSQSKENQALMEGLQKNHQEAIENQTAFLKELELQHQQAIQNQLGELKIMATDNAKLISAQAIQNQQVLNELKTITENSIAEREQTKADIKVVAEQLAVNITEITNKNDKLLQAYMDQTKAMLQVNVEQLAENVSGYTEKIETHVESLVGQNQTANDNIVKELQTITENSISERQETKAEMETVITKLIENNAKVISANEETLQTYMDQTKAMLKANADQLAENVSGYTE
ncbi:MAG: hypothetical protein ACRDCC_07675, partial [Culicoidibacterales bacterium]